ncbi:helicase RepA family protein [Paracoccus sp. DMF-8]|uniref:helicase RepA family protein n=1 Tax=Paracoccus sp. DMF-8 TaxID=3019445 RepID=UPI0023E3E541|nr:helicase RepA family protein [Paracoccus sp. DMF-8]MDF3607912.1 helicase RepA family protein [Paracoccus sp. DMF-8]
MTPPEWMFQPGDPGPMPDHRDYGDFGFDHPAPASNVLPLRTNNGPRVILGEAASINPRPFTFRPASDLPPREWLYGHHLIRQYASATIAPGGVGKTTLTVTDALAMASGRSLIGQKPHGALRVWLWNGEDPTDELERRAIAAMKFHCIRPDEIGDRLFIDSGRDQPIKIGANTPNGPTVAMPVVDALIEAIRSRRIDVLIVDPFVSVHSMPENDNGAMDAAVKAFALVADRTECAIDLVHHSRKLNGADADIDAARGGSAIAGAVRAARVLNVMNKDTAEALGIPADERRSLVRVDDAKSNLAPASSARWFRLASQSLGNGTADRPEDFVAVAEAWTPPDAFDGITTADLLKVQHAVDGKALRENAQANDWAGHVIAPLLGLNSQDKADRARIKQLMRTWIATGALQVERLPDDKGHSRPSIFVGEWAVVND